MSRDEMALIVLAINLLTTTWMLTIVVFVGMVHYPMFRFLASPSFTEAMHYHQKHTGRVVGLPMLLEVLCSCGLLFIRPLGIDFYLPWLGLVLVGITGCVTVFWSVPAHERLLAGYQEAVWRRLLFSNHVRCVFWALHLLVILLMFYQYHTSSSSSAASPALSMMK